VLRTENFPPLAARSNRPATPVMLRICDGDGERVLPVIANAVERVFAPSAAIRAGTEISVTDGEASLVAVAFDAGEAGAEGEVVQFMLSRVSAEQASLTGPLGRSETLRQFRQFVLTAVPETAGPNERVSP